MNNTYSGDGSPTTLHEKLQDPSFVNQAPVDLHNQATERDSKLSGHGIKQNTRNLPALNAIHILFLFYSGAHNTLNAFEHAQNGFFFLFVVVGILSVELMLWSIYKYWKEGRLVGRMLLASKLAGVLAMFFAVAGILAESQAGTANQWLSMYYQWILPCSAPVMFIMAFWIQSLDPIMAALRDGDAYEILLMAEEKRDDLDERRMALNEKRDQRQLRSQLLNLKQNALWKETLSRRTRRQLKTTVREEVPLLLEKAGIYSESSSGNQNGSAGQAGKE